MRTLGTCVSLDNKVQINSKMLLFLFRERAEVVMPSMYSLTVLFRLLKGAISGLFIGLLLGTIGAVADEQHGQEFVQTICVLGISLAGVGGLTAWINRMPEVTASLIAGIVLIIIPFFLRHYDGWVYFWAAGCGFWGLICGMLIGLLIRILK
jgi:hypothetical protein